MNSHFSGAKFTNFHLIYHRRRGDELQNSQGYYKTFFDKNFIYYEENIMLAIRRYRPPLDQSVTIFIS